MREEKKLIKFIPVSRKINKSSVDRQFTETTKDIAWKYVQRYGSIKNAVSAAMAGFELLSAEQREKATEIAFEKELILKKSRKNREPQSLDEGTTKESLDEFRQSLPDVNSPVVCIMDAKQQKLYRSLIKSLEPEAQAKEKEA